MVTCKDMAMSRRPTANTETKAQQMAETQDRIDAFLAAGGQIAKQVTLSADSPRLVLKRKTRRSPWRKRR